MMVVFEKIHKSLGFQLLTVFLLSQLVFVQANYKFQRCCYHCKSDDIKDSDNPKKEDQCSNVMGLTNRECRYLEID